MAKKIKNMIIKKPKDFSFKDSNSDFNKRIVKLEFRKRSIFGKLLKTKKIKIIKFPKGFSLKLVENNRPNVKNIFLSFEKLK